MSIPLFEPLEIRGLTIGNRAWVSPMCTYSVSAQDGVPTDWHLVHLGALAQGGFGMIITEATAVSPEGRISPQDCGLWRKKQAKAWRVITDFVHSQCGTIAVQLAHAGRKASTHPWLPGEPEGSLPAAEGGWTTVAPSPIAFPGLLEPHELDVMAIAQIIEDFASAAERASDAGFDAIEVHAAHGYLLHQFMSPLSNHRTDSYGGSFENRTRLVVEVVDAIRDVWDGPLFVRISATDWSEGGWDVEQSVRLATIFAAQGVDLVDTSSGALVPARIEVGPGYQVPFAEQIRRESGIATGAVGMITTPEQANQILADGRADVVLLAREALRDPRWPQRAARELGLPADQEAILWAPPHLRGLPRR